MYERNLKYDKFIFDGLDCNDNFGIIRCEFDSEDEFSGGEIQTNTYSPRNSNEWKITSSRYSSPISFSLSFCKCNGERFTFEQMENISRWLICEDEYKLMQFYTTEDKLSEDICYECKATKNIKWKMIAGDCFGGTVDFISKHPYARTVDYIETFTVSTKGSHDFVCNSDTKFIYPFEIIIKITSDCDVRFTIVSSIHGAKATEINNCKSGEIIKIDCINKVITTDRESHDIANDFNYIFQKIGCGKRNDINSITGTGDFEMTIKYYEARKVVI